MDRTLAQAAKELGITRPKLIELMLEKQLLDEHNLPRFPNRDRHYLREKEGSWYHPTMGMQYSKSTRVRPDGIQWLADQLDLQHPTAAKGSRDDAA
ncbi:MAG: phage antirepressor KilAC domain-containing protein [Pseudomonas palmensis]|uniref:phage antirepressor KilAC domain-containing protein n=1 Tax=Pseudomonas palmensis TaxID=2815362 RepID=UPI003D146A7E